jgi:hypothetical protein
MFSFYLKKLRDKQEDQKYSLNITFKLCTKIKNIWNLLNLLPKEWQIF